MMFSFIYECLSSFIAVIYLNFFNQRKKCSSKCEFVFSLKKKKRRNVLCVEKIINKIKNIRIKQKKYRFDRFKCASSFRLKHSQFREYLDYSQARERKEKEEIELLTTFLLLFGQKYDAALTHWFNNITQKKKKKGKGEKRIRNKKIKKKTYKGELMVIIIMIKLMLRDDSIIMKT